MLTHSVPRKPHSLTWKPLNSALLTPNGFPADSLIKSSPLLQTVVFRTFSRYDTVSELYRLLVRSCCHIQTMTFHGYSENANFLSILNLVPTLTSLCINNPSSGVIHALCSVDDHGEWRLLPQLRKIKIYLSTVMPTDYKALLQLIRSLCDLEPVGLKSR